MIAIIYLLSLLLFIIQYSTCFIIPSTKATTSKITMPTTATTIETINYRIQSQKLLNQQRSCLSSSSSSSSNTSNNDTNTDTIQPWVATASFINSINHDDMNVNVDVDINIQTSSGNNENKDTLWLHRKMNVVDNDDDDGDGDGDTTAIINHEKEKVLHEYDLSSPREWLEYNEIEDKVQGAYTVLRCDLFLNSNSDTCNHEDKDDPSASSSAAAAAAPTTTDTTTTSNKQRYKIWGKEFHLERISNSFMQMMKSNEKQQPQKQQQQQQQQQQTHFNNDNNNDDKADYEYILNQALDESEKILDALIQKAITTCLDGNVDDDDESHYQNSLEKEEEKKKYVKTLMLTLLWTPSSFTLGTELTNDSDNDNDNRNIKVRGHSYCSNIPSNPKLYNPKPITTSVALPFNIPTQQQQQKQQQQKQKQSQQQYQQLILPSRYDKLPEAKLSSWCRIRRSIETLYKDKNNVDVDGIGIGVSVSVGEVLLAKRNEYNEQHNEHSKDDKDVKESSSTSNSSSSNSSSNDDWVLLEGLTSNLFIVYKDGSIHTTFKESNVLGGYARHLVIQAANKCNIPIVFGPIRLEDGKNGLWVEAFVTSSIRLIVPVKHILIPSSISSSKTCEEEVQQVQPQLQLQLLQPCNLEEFWSEASLDMLPWNERRWLSLYRYLNN